MMNLKTKLILVLFTGVFLLSCTKDSPEPIDTSKEEAKLLDVSYDAGDRNKMDVFLPEGRDESTPLVVLIHGGSWISGDKADTRFIQEELLERNFASVNINYGFTSTNYRYDDMLSDIKKAIEKIKNSSAEWGVRDRGFVILGVSSGAHLGLLYAYGIQQSEEISTVISVAGPTDLSTLTHDPLLNVLIAGILIGVPPQEMATHPRTKQASPLYQVDRAIPTLLVHGTADEVVPYIQSQHLQEALQERSVANKLITLQGAKHEFSLNATDLQKLYTEVQNWIGLHGK